MLREVAYLASYRIAGNFRWYKCSWFTLIRHVPRTFIPTNTVCMLAKAAIPRKGLSAKVYTHEIYLLYGIQGTPREGSLRQGGAPAPGAPGLPNKFSFLYTSYTIPHPYQ